MFGLLKKKLKQSVEKLSLAIKGEEVKSAEEHIAEEIPFSVPEKVLPPPPEEKELMEEELEKTEPPLEVPEEVKKELIEEIKTEAEEHKAELKKKPSIIKRIKKAVTEKKIEEKDILPALSDVQTSLLESDVALEVAEKIVLDLKTQLVGKTVSRKEVESLIKTALLNSIRSILDQPCPDLIKLAKEKKPLKIIFLGFNGTGKTTTIAKLGYMFKQAGMAPIFAAGDTWRAAALEQLEIHGKNLNIPVIKHKYGADPAAVIFDAIRAAEARKLDVVLADTAGRSHANVNLMDEMKKIIRVNKPDFKILVVDCLTGNDAVEQAKAFNDAVGVDGIIMTKADVYDKGGAVLSTAWAIKKPILYMGTGQKYSDLKKFDPEELVKALLT